MTTILTPPRLTAFLVELGIPADAPGESQWPPSVAMLSGFSQAVERYGYWVGSPQENAEIGLDLAAMAG